MSMTPSQRYKREVLLRTVERRVSHLRNEPDADPDERLWWIEEASQTLLELEDIEVNRALARGEEAAG